MLSVWQGIVEIVRMLDCRYGRAVLFVIAWSEITHSFISHALYALGELGSCLEDTACHLFISGLTVISRACQWNAANSKIKGMILL